MKINKFLFIAIIFLSNCCLSTQLWSHGARYLNNHGILESGQTCTHDNQCSDENFCTGIEICTKSNPDADEHGCVTTYPPANGRVRVSGHPMCFEDGNIHTRTVCDVQSSECWTIGYDRDGDGQRDFISGLGQDCDDADNNRFPGNREVCDTEGHDEDCDPNTFGNKDSDGDGHIDAMCHNNGSTWPAGYPGAAPVITR